jgi:hypothetical protein
MFYRMNHQLGAAGIQAGSMLRMGRYAYQPGTAACGCLGSQACRTGHPWRAANNQHMPETPLMRIAATRR